MLADQCPRCGEYAVAVSVDSVLCNACAGTGETQSSTTLALNTDFTITYSYDNGTTTTDTPSKAGTVTVVIKGKGNYTGTNVTKKYTIGAKSITGTDITVEYSPSTYTYTGSAQTPTTVTVKDTTRNTDLTATTDYTVTYPDDVTSAGSKTITVTGAGSYSGTNAGTSYTINQKSIAGSDIEITLTGVPDGGYTYDNTDKKPTVTVRDKTRNVNLTPTTDYTVTYPDDVKSAGSKTITVTGAGNYTGTNTNASYTINKATPTFSLADVSTTTDNYVGEGSTKTAKVTATVAGKWTVTSGDANISIESGNNETTAANIDNTITYKGVTASTTGTTVTVTFAPTDTTNYNAPTSQTFTVKATTITADPTELTLDAGGDAGAVTLGGINAGEFSVNIAPNDSYTTSSNPSQENDYVTVEVDNSTTPATLTVTPKDEATEEDTPVVVTVKEANGGKTVEISVTVETPGKYIITRNGVSNRYATLNKAVKAASTTLPYDTVVVEEDVSTDEEEAIINKNITLDLNGNILTRTTGLIVTSGHELTISGEATGKMTTNSAINLITNSGTLNITGGEIESTYSASTNYKPIVNNGSGEINISGGTITGVYYGIYNSNSNTNGTVNITGGKINTSGETGYRYGIYNCSTSSSYKPSVTITGGTVETALGTTGYGYGIYNYGTYATTTIGDIEEPLNTETPIISGRTNGIYNYSGKWYFYNGLLRGKSAGYTGSWSGGRELCYIKTSTDVESSYETAFLEQGDYTYGRYNSAAWLGGYNTWNEAYSAVSTNQTIKVMKNATETSEITLSSEKNISLDLQKYNLECTAAITINSSLTIKGEEGGTLITNETITNKGTLNLQGGKITSNRQIDVVTNSGTLNVNSGILESTCTYFNYQADSCCKTIVNQGNRKN